MGRRRRTGPARQKLLDAREQFRHLLSVPGTPEARFQKLFTDHPYILSSALPLKLTPADIRPLGRPGKAEVDLVFYPEDLRVPYVYGSIELKRPDTKIIRIPRKNIVTLSADAHTALAQARDHAKRLKRQLRKRAPLLVVGNDAYIFLILGMQSELEARLSSHALWKQFDEQVPPGCNIMTYDMVLSGFERTVPPRVHILTPGESRGELSHPDPPARDNQLYWHLAALDCARHAHEEMFPSRRGVYPLIVSDEGRTVLCVYNNNPYSRDPHLRDEETDRFRTWLRDQGITEFAFATYPRRGEDRDYSYAMLIDVSEDDEERTSAVMDKLREVAGESIDRLNQLKDGLA